MYIQTEFCLDLSQGNTESLPVWMKAVSDRQSQKPKLPKTVQLPLFDISLYAN